jgi:quercetin dioxygenase-like cupin family protein
MDSWRLPEIETPAGRRSPVVLHSGEETRVVLIVLDPGQELGEHQVKEHAWIAVVDGHAEFSANGQTVDGPTGTLLHFQPDERHSVRSDDGARLLILLAPWPGEGHYWEGEAAS